MIHDTIQAEGKELPLVSIIIPVYNAQDYVGICIQSVLDQTYQNFEIICVSDGSTDKSIEIIRRLAYDEPRIQLIQIENHGQGYARNLALKRAQGKYILFLDADDFIEPITLDISVTRAEKDASDFVVFDWRYYNPVTQTSNYCNEDDFFAEHMLEGQECLKLLQVESIFSVNKLYRHSFLADKNIEYGEGHLYEDNPFWIKAVINATKVSLIPSPLYRITISKTSSTKTDIETDRHCRGYITAVSDSIAFINSSGLLRDENGRYSIAKYFLEKFIYYYFQRTPQNLRKQFLRQFVDELSNLDFQDQGGWKLLSLMIRFDVFKKKSYLMFTLLLNLAANYKPRIKRYLTAIKAKSKKIYHKLSEKKVHIKWNTAKEDPWGKYNTYLRQSLYSDVILFMGFDFRYTGNSRYLFEEMQRIGCNKKLFFVTDSPLVPLEHRIEPNSDCCARFVARSKVIIFESWIPLKYEKRDGTTWIQLWHGTPLKRMLFDSHEKAILLRNSKQKTSKYKDISRWDYLTVDNPYIASFFQTAFLLPPKKMLFCGYPRVKYLIDKRSDLNYRNMLKEIYRVPARKKVVLYLPTWRDYNYNTNGFSDMGYAMDVQQLQMMLGDEYLVICKDHAFLPKLESDQLAMYIGAETQELLLIADYLVTDYSSVMFDAFAIDLPVILYCNDFEKNEAVRGVYLGMWNDVLPLNCTTVEEVFINIKNYNFQDICSKVKEKYSYRPAGPHELTTFISNI